MLILEKVSFAKILGILHKLGQTAHKVTFLMFSWPLGLSAGIVPCIKGCNGVTAAGWQIWRTFLADTSILLESRGIASDISNLITRIEWF